MKYEVMTYTCSAGDYHVIYYYFGIHKLAVLMTMDIHEVNVYLKNQKDCDGITWTNYVDAGTHWAKTTCKECD